MQPICLGLAFCESRLEGIWSGGAEVRMAALSVHPSIFPERSLQKKLSRHIDLFLLTRSVT